MGLLSGWVKKTYYNELLKAEGRGYDRAGRELKFRMEDTMKEQENVFELRLLAKNCDIDLLERKVDDLEKRIELASSQFQKSKMIFLEAKKIITRVEMSYRNHAENSTRIMAEFQDIRRQAEDFDLKLISG